MKWDMKLLTSVECSLKHISFFLFAGEFLRSLTSTRKLMLSVSMILCIILQLCRVAFLPHYRNYSDGGIGVLATIFY